MSSGTKKPLVEMERKALSLKAEGRCAEAAELLKDLLRQQPNWEHGHAAYALAGCEEELGHLDAARSAYAQALSADAENVIFLGGYASFLMMNGSDAEAFDAHLKLLTVERKYGDHDAAEETVRILHQLGARLGLSEREIESL